MAMAPHSSTLAWKIPWAKEPGRLQWKVEGPWQDQPKDLSPSNSSYIFPAVTNDQDEA